MLHQWVAALRVLGLAAVAAGLITSPALRAQSTAIANIGATAGISNVAVGKTAIPENFSQAFSFTTGSTAVSLASVTLSMFVASSGGLTGFSLSLYGGISSGGPSTLITSFTGATNPVNTASYVYTPSSPTALGTGTEYWLVASAPSVAAGNNNFRINSTTSFTEDSGGVAGWSIGDLRWITNDAGATSWFSSVGGIPQFSVQVSAVPEPATGAVFAGVAVLGLAAAWRRRRA